MCLFCVCCVCNIVGVNLLCVFGPRFAGRLLCVWAVSLLCVFGPCAWVVCVCLLCEFVGCVLLGVFVGHVRLLYVFGV